MNLVSIFFNLSFDLSQFRMRHACQAHVHRIYAFFVGSFFFLRRSTRDTLFYLFICVWSWRSERIFFSVCLSHTHWEHLESFFHLDPIFLPFSIRNDGFYFLSFWKSKRFGFVVSLMCRSRCHVNTDNIKHLNAALCVPFDECVRRTSWQISNSRAFQMVRTCERKQPNHCNNQFDSSEKKHTATKQSPKITTTLRNMNQIWLETLAIST